MNHTFDRQTSHNPPKGLKTQALEKSRLIIAGSLDQKIKGLEWKIWQDVGAAVTLLGENMRLKISVHASFRIVSNVFQTQRHEDMKVRRPQFWLVNISTEWISTHLYNIQGSQRVNPTNFCDPLTFCWRNHEVDFCSLEWNDLYMQ